MAVSKRDIEALHARVGDLERQVEHLAGLVAAARPLLDDAGRLEDLAERAGRLAAAAEAALQALHGRGGHLGARQARFRAAFDTVHRAEAHGYVALSVTRGPSDKIRLLVGPDDPPAECVGEINNVSDDSFLGAVVRPGEYWTAASVRHRTSGFACLFTPLF
jgi:hypothetical protein